jgi:hypothetical protein
MERPACSGYLGVRYEPGSRASQRGHVESYFLKANDPHRRRALWLKATIYATKRAPYAALAEAWAVAFDAYADHVAVKSSIPFARARFSKTALDIDVDGVIFRPGEARGAVASGGRSVAWDLRLEGDAPPIVHYPPWMYDAPLPSSKLVSPFPDLRVSGEAIVNGETWTLDRWPGLLGHNWGPRHTPEYAWGHCNSWEGGNANQADELVLEGVSGRMKVGPILARLRTVICVRYRGVRYDLSSVRDLLRNRADVSPRRWTFAGQNDLIRVRGEMFASTDDFVGLFYVNPDDTMTHCLNTKLAHAEVELTVRGRAPFTARSRAAALEIGTMDPRHGVRMYV